MQKQNETNQNKTQNITEKKKRKKKKPQIFLINIINKKEALSVVVSDFLNPLLCVYVAVHTFLFQAFIHSSLVSRHSP